MPPEDGYADTSSATDVAIARQPAGVVASDVLSCQKNVVKRALPQLPMNHAHIVAAGPP